MRVKVILPVFLMLLAGHTLYAQLRDYVFIVYPVYDDKTLSFVDGLAAKLDKSGYKDLSAVATAWKKGGFGSGFLYIQDNKKYIITNRHVVGDGSLVKIEQESSDGKKVTFEGNKIIAIDADLDLAIVELTAQNSFTQGMKFSNTRPKDGTEVWSAGYPGLGNKPSWQLGKGVVTNANARVEDIIDTEKSDLIQHSAQVDSGNSGGPLLVEDKTAPGGYSVVGINTWKARYREGTNFSLPSAPTVINFVKLSLSPATQESSDKSLKDRSDYYAKISAINNEDDPNQRIRQMANFISLDYVMSSGEDILFSVLSSAPTRVRNEAVWIFANSSPLDAIRFAIAYDIDKKMKDEENQSSLEWTEVNKGWWISSISDFKVTAPDKTDGKTAKESKSKTTDKSESKISVEKAYDSLLFVEYNLSFSNPDSVGFGYFMSFFKYFGLGLVLDSSIPTVKSVDTSGVWGDDTSEGPGFLFRPGLFIRGLCPLSTGSLGIIPYVEGRIGYQYVTSLHEAIDPPPGAYAAVGGGVQLSFGSTYAPVVLGIGGGMEQMLTTSGEYAIDKSETRGAYLNITLGIGLWR